ncbi:MAG TPA: YeeE/YedE thiosulfate transporter family protein [Pseudolabrys sp.]|nr:YeeE/YedE thiosulfate transporter family protein [Pseudolabrys sp.]
MIHVKAAPPHFITFERQYVIALARSQDGGLRMLTRQAWSPYLAGIVIGLLQIPAFLLIETALGASSSYVTVGGIISSWLDPSILKIDYVVRHVAATGKNWWQVALVIGIAIGAFISMKLSGAQRAAISPIWQRALGSASPARRYAVAFIGGFVLLLGARIADGCTSGHGLSGMAQLSVGSTVAVAAMFTGGIATAMLLLRRI